MYQMDIQQYKEHQTKVEHIMRQAIVVEVHHILITAQVVVELVQHGHM